MKPTNAPNLLRFRLNSIVSRESLRRNLTLAWGARLVFLLLPFLLDGCFLKKHPPSLPPAAPEAEAAPLTTSPVELPPSANTVSIPAPEPETQPNTPPPHKPKRPVRHKKPAVVVAAPASQPANNPEVSAIGQLSSGDSSDLRRETASSIAATEHGLDNIGRKLNGQEEKTAGQIREFLKQARVALGSGDVDGAHTLAAKAKVLLGELSR